MAASLKPAGMWDTGRSAMTKLLLRRSSLRGSTSPPKPAVELFPGRRNSQLRTCLGGQSVSLSAPRLRMFDFGAELCPLTQVQPQEIAAHTVVQPRAVQDKLPFYLGRDFGRATQGLQRCLPQLRVEHDECRSSVRNILDLMSGEHGVSMSVYTGV